MTFSTQPSIKVNQGPIIILFLALGQEKKQKPNVTFISLLESKFLCLLIYKT